MMTVNTLFPLILLTSLCPEGILGTSPCDSLVPEYCGLPYPNSYFTMTTQSTSTGIKLNLSEQVFPKNTLGVPLPPNKWNQFGEDGTCGIMGCEGLLVYW